MIDWFVWKGIRCTSLGIRALTLPDITIPEERVSYTDIVGESGSFVSREMNDYPVFNDLELNVTCVVENMNNLDEIAKYLRGTSTIEFANNPGGYFKATINNQIPFSKIVRGNPHRTFTVPLRCEPFWYFNHSTKYTRTFAADANPNYSFDVINPGNVYSRPLIKVLPDWEIVTDEETGETKRVAKGPVTIDINGKSIIVEAIPGDSPVVIDTKLKEAYDDRVKPYPFRNTSIKCDDFPILDVGKNTIHVNGPTRGIEIDYRWRKLC